jgi:8-oxo-dGTP pyrophosphatase MutT (NUDIX family)
VGHITGAAWLLDCAGERVLLTHHRKLGKWLQPGGHADGDPDPLRVAMREATEESGIDGIVPVRADIFDLDIHEIPPHGGVPAHLHYDVRFLLRVEGDDAYRVGDESVDLAWVPVADIETLDADESVLRMREKWLGKHVERPDNRARFRPAACGGDRAG